MTRVWVIADDEAEALRLATDPAFWRDGPKEALSNADELPNCRAWSVDVEIIIPHGTVPELIPHCQICKDTGEVGDMSANAETPFETKPCPRGCKRRED